MNQGCAARAGGADSVGGDPNGCGCHSGLCAGLARSPSAAGVGGGVSAQAEQPAAVTIN